MRDEFDEPQPMLDPDAVAQPDEGEAAQDAARLAGQAAQQLAPELSPQLPTVPAGIELHNRDFLTDAAALPDQSIDLILADPPYGLGKDYGNDSDMRSGDDFLAWTRIW